MIPEHSTAEPAAATAGIQPAPRPQDAAGRRGKRAGKGLAGLAALACVACCALPALITAGLIGGGAAAALAGAMPQIAIVLAITAAAVFGWAVRLSRRRSCTDPGAGIGKGGCASGCSCSTTVSRSSPPAGDGLARRAG